MSPIAPGGRPIAETCYWLAAHRREPGPPLDGTQETELAIVGAGFTGLWTALHLKRLRPDCAVAIVEQGTIAHGASGRNAGILGESIDHSHALAIAHFGRDEAQALARLGRQNLGELLAFLDERGIDCDLERSGTLNVALSAAQLADLEHLVAAARELSVSEPRLLSRDEVRAELHCERYEGALFDPCGGILDPVKLALGLQREAAALGVRIYEQTRVRGIDTAGAGVQLLTDGGVLRARRVILATSAYTHLLAPELRFRFLPLFDYVIASEPLSAAQKAALGWRNRQGVTDVRNFFKYYRLTKDDRLVFGTSEARYYPGNRVGPECDHSESHYAELRESVVRHFPALAGLRFPYAWGGAICATTRFTPFFGSLRGGRILYGLGYTGHGIGTTHLGGRILAHLALAAPSPLLELSLVRKPPFPYPPEPLRRWAVERVTRALRRVDEGRPPGLLLRLLDALGIGLSS